MLIDEGRIIKCDGLMCDKQFKNNYWASVKEGKDWFIPKNDNLAFCPDHLPSWVQEWRSKK